MVSTSNYGQEKLSSRRKSSSSAIVRYFGQILHNSNEPRKNFDNFTPPQPRLRKNSAHCKSDSNLSKMRVIPRRTSSIMPKSTNSNFDNQVRRCTSIDFSSNQPNFLAPNLFLDRCAVLIHEKKPKPRWLYADQCGLHIAKIGPKRQRIFKEFVNWAEIWIRRLDPVMFPNLQHSLLIGYGVTHKIIEFGSKRDIDRWVSLIEKYSRFENSGFYGVNNTVNIIYDDGCAHINRKVLINGETLVHNLSEDTLQKFYIYGKNGSEDFEIFVEFGRCLQRTKLTGFERVVALAISHVNEFTTCDQNLTENSLTLFIVKKHNPKKKRSQSFSIERKNTEFLKSDSIFGNLKRHFRKSNIHDEENPIPKKEGLFFGQSLQQIWPDSSEEVPKNLGILMNVVYNEGLHLEGLFRKSPNHKQFREMRDFLDLGGVLEDQGVENQDDILQPHLCCSILKELLRRLPGTLLTPEYLPIWLQLASSPASNNEHQKITLAKRLLSRMPRQNRLFLAELCFLLNEVVKHRSSNQMSSLNLSICLAPSLINFEEKVSLQNDPKSQLVTKLTQFLIEKPHLLFPVDPNSIYAKYTNSRDSSDYSVIKQRIDSIDSVFEDDHHSTTSSSASSSLPNHNVGDTSATCRLSSQPSCSKDSGLSIDPPHDQYTFKWRYGNPSNPCFKENTNSWRMSTRKIEKSIDNSEIENRLKRNFTTSPFTRRCGVRIQKHQHTVTTVRRLSEPPTNQEKIDNTGNRSIIDHIAQLEEHKKVLHEAIMLREDRRKNFVEFFRKLSEGSMEESPV